MRQAVRDIITSNVRKHERKKAKVAGTVTISLPPCMLRDIEMVARESKIDVERWCSEVIQCALAEKRFPYAVEGLGESESIGEFIARRPQ